MPSLDTSISWVSRRLNFHLRLSRISNWVEMILDRVQPCESVRSFYCRSRYSREELKAKPFAISCRP